MPDKPELVVLIPGGLDEPMRGCAHVVLTVEGGCFVCRRCGARLSVRAA